MKIDIKQLLQEILDQVAPEQDLGIFGEAVRQCKLCGAGSTPYDCQDGHKHGCVMGKVEQVLEEME